MGVGQCAASVRFALISDPANQDWLALRHALWPHHALDWLTQELKQLCAMHRYQSFIAYEGEQRLGFVEFQPRSHAYGTMVSPVLYLEGFWVEAAYRRQGVGRALMQQLTDYAKAHNFAAIASDAEATNAVSARAHEAYGFRDAGVLRHFVKEL